jgi:hypothetical protein
MMILLPACEQGPPAPSGSREPLATAPPGGFAPASGTASDRATAAVSRAEPTARSGSAATATASRAGSGARGAAAAAAASAAAPGAGAGTPSRTSADPGGTAPAQPGKPDKGPTTNPTAANAGGGIGVGVSDRPGRGEAVRNALAGSGTIGTGIAPVCDCEPTRPNEIGALAGDRIRGAGRLDDLRGPAGVIQR